MRLNSYVWQVQTDQCYLDFVFCLGMDSTHLTGMDGVLVGVANAYPISSILILMAGVSRINYALLLRNRPCTKSIIFNKMNVNQFMSTISSLVFKACDIIRDVHFSQKLKVVMKGQRNPVTVADIAIQAMIVNGLTSLWPSINIVGQENLSSYSFPAVSSKQRKHVDTGSPDLDYFHDTVLPFEDFCVWIDPLDGTLSFTDGRVQQVTILVGISYKQKARIGVIGIPYSKNLVTGKSEFNPKVILGDCESMEILQVSQNLSSHEISAILKTGLSKIVVSTNLPPSQMQIVKNLCSSPIEAFAMGNKFMYLLRQKATAFVYMGNVASLWDTCAGQALIKCLGGTVTNLFGQDIIYDNQQPSYQLGKGMICALDKICHSQIKSLSLQLY